MVTETATVVTVLGGGSWGTALAVALARNGHAVRLWAHRAEHVEAMRGARENPRFLPGTGFPAGLAPTVELEDAVSGAGAVLVAVPSHAYAQTLRKLAECFKAETGLAWATKGLDHVSGRFLHDVTAEVLGRDCRCAVVSGPSFAREVAQGLPTAITVASVHQEFAERTAALLRGPRLRAYTTTDVVGVELGGALKNVMAIAAGISDGLGFGANARAALITRGLAEMVRLGHEAGARAETLMGLAGLGDLVLTCTDDQSRNRRFGLALGQGHAPESAFARVGQVVEGAAAVSAAVTLAAAHGVEMPISEQVNEVVHQGKAPRLAVEALLARDPKTEHG